MTEKKMKRPNDIGGFTKQCRWCGMRFTETAYNRIYCSNHCEREAKKNSMYRDSDPMPGKLLEPEVRICKTCGRPFVTNHEGRRYCSDKCRFYPDIVKAEIEKANGNVQEVLQKGALQ